MHLPEKKKEHKGGAPPPFDLLMIIHHCVSKQVEKKKGSSAERQYGISVDTETSVVLGDPSVVHSETRKKRGRGQLSGNGKESSERNLRES